MKTTKVLLFFVILFCTEKISFSQNAPAHLKYFGYAVVDCGFADPNDSAAMTNYISEVDTFSNIAQLCVNDYTDTIISRVNLMNNHCVMPILSTSNIFYYLKDNNAPSGSNYDLYPNYFSRWNTFKNINSFVLNSSNIGMIYIVDEPTWNGITFPELDTVCALIKSDFPNIPIMFIEAYTEVDSLQVPTSIDWFGFDRYGIFDVSTDSTYLSELSIVETKRSAPKQKIFLVADDQFMPNYAGMGWQPDTIQYVLQNYYNLAASDTNIIGLVGFTWPGLSLGWLGTRELPQKVIDKNVQIGKMIKANYSPCTTAEIKNEEQLKAEIKIYPNPTQDILNIYFHQNSVNTNIKLVNLLGEVVYEKDFGTLPDGIFTSKIDVSHFSDGIYDVLISSENRQMVSKKIIIQK